MANRFKKILTAEGAEEKRKKGDLLQNSCASLTCFYSATK
jgi:hypothetical protein